METHLSQPSFPPPSLPHIPVTVCYSHPFFFGMLWETHPFQEHKSQLKYDSNFLDKHIPPYQMTPKSSLFMISFILWKWFLCQKLCVGLTPPFFAWPCSILGHSSSQAVGEAAIQSPWTKQGFPWQQELCGGSRRGFPCSLRSPHPGSFNSIPHPWFSHGGVSNQGRKTGVLNISNWLLEAIVLHATGRKKCEASGWMNSGISWWASRVGQRKIWLHFCPQTSLDSK